MQVFESGLFSAMLHRARDTEYSVRKEAQNRKFSDMFIMF